MVNMNKKIVRTLLITVIVLVSARLALPYIVRYYANRTLAHLQGYYGHVGDVHMAVYRGAAIVNGLYLNKIDPQTGNQVEFFTARAIDGSIEWGALFHGSIVGKISADAPRLIFTKDKTDPAKVSKDTPLFRRLLKKFMPLKINRLEIKDGAIHYVDAGKKPPVDASLKQVHVLALNLTNVVNNTIPLPSTVTANAAVYGGSLNATVRLNALAQYPTFEMNGELKDADLTQFNDLLKAYGKFVVNRGRLGVYTEMAAKDGKLTGYIKPIIRDLDVTGPGDTNKNIFHKMWESMVGTTAYVFKNQKKDQLATKIPIAGDFKDPTTDKIYSLWEVLQNAFIKALKPSLDNGVNINSIDGKKKK